MLKRGNLFALLAVCVAATVVVYTANAQEMRATAGAAGGDQAGNTQSGTVVDLGTYLQHRMSGEDPQKAMDAAGKSMMGGAAGGASAGGMMHMVHALVTTEGAMGGGANVYVLVPDTGNAGAMMGIHRMLGQKVKITGKEMSQDGIKAMTVQKLEGQSGSSAGGTGGAMGGAGGTSGGMGGSTGAGGTSGGMGGSSGAGGTSGGAGAGAGGATGR